MATIFEPYTGYTSYTTDNSSYSVWSEPNRWYKDANDSWKQQQQIDPYYENLPKKRELSLDEILFDDDESFKKKQQEEDLLRHMLELFDPSVDAQEVLHSYPGNVIYTKDVYDPSWVNTSGTSYKSWRK